MSNVSLPYTTLDGRVGFAEPVPVGRGPLRAAVPHGEFPTLTSC